MSAEVLRLFLAVPLKQVFLKDIQEVLTPLRAKIPGIKWTEPEQVHITLHFFGDTQAAEVKRIDQAMRNILPRFGPVSARLNGVGGFPDLRRPHVLWIGVEEESGVLLELQRAVLHEVKGLGFDVESRPFKPHATLGRVKKIPSSVSIQEEIGRIKFALPTLPKTLDHFVLYQSRLLPGGARYEVLRSFPLAKAS